MRRDLPVYRMVIEESEESELEVNYVALVDNPAIEREFMAFREEGRMKFEADEDRRIITGPLMLADVPIYRRRGDIEFYVVFEKGEIFKIAQKFFEKGYQRNVNLMHDGCRIVEGATIFESWLVDSKRGVLPMKGYEDAKDGSWFGSMKITNEEVWRKVKAGEFRGFSVEGIFEIRPLEMTEEEKLLKEIIKVLRGA